VVALVVAQVMVVPLLVVQEEQEVEQPLQPLQNVLVQVDVLLVKYLTPQALKPHVHAVQTVKPLGATVALVALVEKVEIVDQQLVVQVDRTLPQWVTKSTLILVHLHLLQKTRKHQHQLET
jgi:hypothetical protein